MQDKSFIKSFIKNPPRGAGFGISDDFPEEVDEVRKLLYPLLKAAKREKKAAYSNVEKMIIEGALNNKIFFLRVFNGQLS